MIEKIRNFVADAQSFIPPQKKKDIGIVFEPTHDTSQDRAGSIMVEADRTKVFGVLSNLLRNAVKFTEAGTIALSVHKHDGFAVVSIKDTGREIDPAIMPRLFEKFATKSESGTGIGLFISKSIIEAHGGRIWAENNMDGKGAMFYFSLPLLPQKPAAGVVTANLSESYNNIPHHTTREQSHDI